MPTKKTSKSKRTSTTCNRRRKPSQLESLLSQRWVQVIIAAVIVTVGYAMYQNHQDSTLSGFHAQPYNVVKPLAHIDASPKALLSPTAVRNIYHLSSAGGGSGTIAIVDAYDDPNIANDLNVFDAEYGLPACTVANGCFTKYEASNRIPSNSSWAIEESLDVEWAHAIAPSAKILLVEANSDGGVDLLNAINYAKSRPGVVSISMSWGGDEFSSEAAYESYFTSSNGAIFFAASGDGGHGTSWPAVSANVIGVGGTSVVVNSAGNLVSESAWSGSGGGVSSYIPEPQRQKTANLPDTNGHRATPDVAYNADPNSGYPVYDSVPYDGTTGWYEVGGTSAGTPQWAAIAALSHGTLTANQIYADATKTNQTTFRDITTGTNGTCGYYCTTRAGYDYVTGFGTPLVTSF